MDMSTRPQIKNHRSSLNHIAMFLPRGNLLMNVREIVKGVKRKEVPCGYVVLGQSRYHKMGGYGRSVDVTTL
jgi:hypothetical protein